MTGEMWMLLRMLTPTLILNTNHKL